MSAPTLSPSFPVRVSRLTERLGGRLGRREWIAIGAMSAAVVGLHVVGWGLLLAVVGPHHYSLGSGTGAGMESGTAFGVGLGVTAYTLGMRHAFDADHIAAIDNTTRKLMSDGQRPVSIGFWFSLGHSSVVFGLCTLLAFGVRALVGQVENGSSTLQTTAGLIGTSVSGAFLYLIGILNLFVLAGVLRVFRRMRTGVLDEAELEHHLNNRGFMNRILGRVTRAVRRPGQMYGVGLLFGLGFDTATEVSLLVLAGGAAAFALPWYAIMTLPILFAAGMSLLDTIDGCFMNFAYGWAFSNPVRKVYYNLTITALSVAVALIIGTIELLSVLTDRLGITTGPLAAVAAVNLNNVGFGIVGVFVLAWAGALAFWKFGHIEEKWTPAPEPTTPD